MTDPNRALWRSLSTATRQLRPGLLPRVTSRALPRTLPTKNVLFRAQSISQLVPKDSMARTDKQERSLRCPYEAGSRLKLSFIPEGLSCFHQIEVDVVKSFQPFTISQCLLVDIITQSRFLPPRFVVKLVDPRFSEQPDKRSLSANGWTRICDSTFKAGLQKIRRGIWNNYWIELGAQRNVDSLWWDELLETERNEAELARWLCMGEVNRWLSYRSALTIEAEAYRRLRKLQGSSVPRLYGACQHALDNIDQDLDPFIATVPGLIIEYIEGSSLEDLIRRQDLSEEDRERIAQGALAAVRRIRDSLVIHNDVAPRNIIVRREDPDHPVIIDFGCAWLGRGTIYNVADLEDWILSVGSEDEPNRLRQLLASQNFHNPSPVPEFIRDSGYHKWIESVGYGMVNDEIEKLPSSWRHKNYERIIDVPPDNIKILPNGETRVWKHLRWRLRPDAKTDNATADYRWGRKELGHVPPWSWSE